MARVRLSIVHAVGPHEKEKGMLGNYCAEKLIKGRSLILKSQGEIHPFLQEFRRFLHESISYGEPISFASPVPVEMLRESPSLGCFSFGLS